MKENRKSESKMQPNTRIPLNFRLIKEIPIVEIAEKVGLETDSRGHFCCPCHNDTHPSAGFVKHAAKWHCFSCNHTGDGLDLAASVLGETPYNAAMYLSQFYPDILPQNSDYKQNSSRPRVPANFYKEIGLNSNPYVKQKVSFTDEAIWHSLQLKRRKIGKEEAKVTMEVYQEEWESTALVIDKIGERQSQLVAEKKMFLSRYPGIPEEVARYVQEETLRLVKDLEEVKGQFLEYYRKLEDLIPEQDMAAYLGLDEELEEEQEERDR